VLFAIAIASRKIEILGMSLITADNALNGAGEVVRRDRLGGLLSFYRRKAA
jgi:hypothetical protein